MNLSSKFAALYLFFYLAASPTLALGHADGEDYVFVNFYQDRIEGEFQINYQDLEKTFAIDIPDDGPEALAVIRANAATVEQYIESNFSIRSPEGKRYTLEFAEAQIVPDTTYGRYPFRSAVAAPPDNIVIYHNLFYENDPRHRGLFLVQYNALEDKNYGEEYTALIFNPDNREQTLNLKEVPGLLSSLDMVWQGMLHIWLGLDHVLFILALMLPTVLIRQSGTWHPVEGYKKSLYQLVKIVTIFTLAHSVTLVLAALDIIKVNSRIVESMIALSIILVAAVNLSPKAKQGSAWIILCLGLFHGLGFATVMGNLPFRMGDLLKMVIRFNIGVELGQLVIVSVLFPVLYFLRNRINYEQIVLRGGSIGLIVIAGYWFVQRAFLLE